MYSTVLEFCSGWVIFIYVFLVQEIFDQHKLQILTKVTINYYLIFNIEYASLVHFLLFKFPHLFMCVLMSQYSVYSTVVLGDIFFMYLFIFILL